MTDDKTAALIREARLWEDKPGWTLLRELADALEAATRERDAAIARAERAEQNERELMADVDALQMTAKKAERSERERDEARATLRELAEAITECESPHDMYDLAVAALNCSALGENGGDR